MQLIFLNSRIRNKIGFATKLRFHLFYNDLTQSAIPIHAQIFHFFGTNSIIIIFFWDKTEIIYLIVHIMSAVSVLQYAIQFKCIK